MFVGIDGCEDGWIAVLISTSGFERAVLGSTFASLMKQFKDATVIGVDMPCGLVAEGAREADQAARDYKGQASSVFSSPPLPVLKAKDYKEACQICRRVNGKSMSKQAFAIVPKIIEVRAFFGDKRLHEVHPEVSFRLMNGGEKLGKKKSWGGIRARLTFLKSAGIELPDDLGDANRVAIDDIVDAAATAWTARRIARGEARSFPAKPAQCGRSGRMIAILG